MGRPRPWTEYEQNALGFAMLLGIEPQARYRKFFRAAERGADRIGVVTGDTEVTNQIVQTLVLWRVMIHPDTCVAVCHGRPDEGKRWIREVEEMVATGDEGLHKELLFAQDKTAIQRVGFPGWNVATCSPDLLVNSSSPLRHHRGEARPIVVVLDPVDLVGRERLEVIVAMKPDLLICTNRHLMV
jgi:hypothetical protein